MSKRYQLSAIRTALILLCLTACQSETKKDAADTVILVARVLTMDGNNTVAEAVAIQHGKIVFVGSSADAKNWIAETTVVVNAEGKTVLPGLIDTHIHPITSAVQMDDCSLDDEKLLITQMADKINACLASANAEHIFPVINLNPADFAASRYDLDQISKKPFALFGSDGHTAWANSAAIARAGITRDTADPANGRLTRDKNGEPTGHLVDDAVGLLSPYLPQDDLATKIAMSKKAIAGLHATGITSMMEASANESELLVYAELAKQQALTIHTSVALFSEADNSKTNRDRLRDLRTRYGDGQQWSVNTIKIFADGVLEYPTQSAALKKPYYDGQGQPTHHAGKLYVDPAELNAFVTGVQQDGFDVHFHAIGDHAVAVALDAFAAARSDKTASPRQFSISHLQLIDPVDVKRFAALNVFASFQLFWAKPENYSVEAVQPYIGESRTQMMYPARSVHEAGGIIVGGSDWNVSSFNPFEAIAAGMCRCNEQDPSRPPLVPDQALDRATLLRAYTINAAQMLGRDKETGSLEVGKWADVILVDRAVDQIDVEALRGTQVIKTFAKGKLVHQI